MAKGMYSVLAWLRDVAASYIIVGGTSSIFLCMGCNMQGMYTAAFLLLLLLLFLAVAAAVSSAAAVAAIVILVVRWW